MSGSIMIYDGPTIAVSVDGDTVSVFDECAWDGFICGRDEIVAAAKAILEWAGGE